MDSVAERVGKPALVRGLLALFAILVIGLSGVAALLVLLIAIFGWPSISRVVAGRNPLVRNEFIDDIRERINVVVKVAAVAFLASLLFDGVIVTIGWAIVGAVALWKYPPFAAGLICYLAMTMGGSLLFVAPVAVVLIARRWNRHELAIPASAVYTATSLVWAFIALLLTLPFISQTAGGGSGGRPGDAGDSAFARAIRRLLGLDDGDPAEIVEGQLLQPVEPPPPDEPTDWPWLWIAIIAAVVIAALLLAWWLRRRSQDELLPAEPLARLEAVGEHLGQPRASHEGALAYSQRLAVFTGDRRLMDTGSLVSGEVYESRSVDPRRTEHQLGELESAPPDLDHVPVVLRMRRAWRGHRVAVVAGVVLAVAIIAAVVVFLVVG